MAVLTTPETEGATPARASSSVWSLQLVFAVALAVTARLAYSLYGWWRLHVAPPYSPIFHGNWENLEPAPGSPAYPWLAPWMHLDALWYNHIAIAGYQPGTGSIHFPPLFPLLGRIFMPEFGGSFGFSGMFVNLVAAIAGFYFLQRLAALDGRQDDARRAALYMVAYPVGFFLFAPFTEATFFALTVASLYCARKGAWWWAGLWGFLATLSRWQGALLAPALLVEYGWQYWKERRRPDAHVLSTALPGVSYILFTIYARFIAHEPLSMGQVNAYWGIKWLPPWQVLQLGIERIVSKGDGLELLNLLAILAAAVATIVAIRYLRPSFVVYMAAQVLFAALHISAVSPLASAARYMLTLFPAFLLLGRAGDNPRLHQAILIFFFLLQGIFLWQFVVGEWVA